MKRTADKLMESLLIPYMVFCLLHFLMHVESISIPRFISYLQTYIWGISRTKKIFVNSLSIGPAYFILLLFCVRVMYMFIDKYTKSMREKFIIVLGISFVGMLLGNYGFWLPWSLDCAAYALIFYYLGLCFRQYQLLEIFVQNKGYYFFLAVIWAYMIYTCSMELEIRQYEPYGVVIIGALSGILIIYMLSAYIDNNMPYCINRLFGLSGKNTLYILILHTCFSNIIYDLWENVFAPKGIFHMSLCVVTQLALGICIGEILGILKKESEIIKRRI